MAGRENKFKSRYNARNKTATDDIVEQLYETESSENNKPDEVIPVSEPKIETIPTPEVVIQTPVTPVPSVAPVISATEETLQAEPVNVVKEKRKAGRPKKTNEARSIFNVKLTVSEKEMLNVAASANGKTRVDYLVGLLKNDYEANKQYYEAVKANIIANR